MKQIKSAESWLNGLYVDPVKLRFERGMKGKKHFVEWLVGYQAIIDFYSAVPGGASEAERVRMHVLNHLNILDTPAYHDLASTDRKRFSEDVLSYLYACSLAKDFGFDMKFYLAEISQILPRIYEHAPSRGASQRMALIRRLGALGLPATDAMNLLIDKTQIRQRKSVAELQKIHVYLMVHEISHLTDGGRHPPKLLNIGDMAYLSDLMEGLLDPMLEDVDLLSEVIEAMICLGFVNNENIRKALSFIALSQNENGSFGAYEDERNSLRLQGSAYDVDVGMYLHATTVCLRALIAANAHSVGREGEFACSLQ
ncbi:hypothetical protein [Thiobacillus sp.]|uniref:DUF6895 family protein n=1 Tax=Thiobacillus sp. TaxID=924 RepID=UPI0025FFBDA9|nr:hypothetical protein [Thiobacillus sp.]